MQNDSRVSKRDMLIGAALFVAAFGLYLRTLAPSVAFLFDDTLEFQYIVPRLGIIHQTGYPLYALLGKLFTVIVPLNDPAYRLNLLSALMGGLAIVMLYFVLRHLVVSRSAAVIGALLFAVGQTFWSQAVIAETYTTQMLIVAILFYLAITWREKFEQGENDAARRRFYALAFSMGIGLTHHRLILLLYPAIVLYIFLVDRSALREGRILLRAALLFLLPLTLYLYLPLRGTTGSADGLYENSIAGFFAWILAQQYTAFLTSNPLNIQRDLAYYWTLFENQSSILGLALAGIGFGLLGRQSKNDKWLGREWVMLVVAFVLQALFVFNYHVANVYVHFLTTFWLISIFASAGADAILGLEIGNLRLSLMGTVYRSLFVLLLALIPIQLLVSNYPTNDLSGKWDVHDYGQDILNQPLENNSTLVGILGEMTLVRYFQDNASLRPDVQTVPADLESERLVGIENALKQNRAVYLTRPLKNAAQEYSLSSVGPLIRVQPKPVTTAPKISNPLDPVGDFGAVQLLGYDLDNSRLSGTQNWHAENGRTLRITVYWRADSPGKNFPDGMVSLKIIGPGGRVAGQLDRHPVLDAYPTNDWRLNEVIADTYDVPIFLGAIPGEYTVSVTMYDPASGDVMGAQPLGKVALTPDFVAPRRDAWNIAATNDVDFGPVGLAGYTLETDTPARPGDALPLVLLWRAAQSKTADGLKIHVWLEDEEGKLVASRDAPMGLGYPVSQWQAGQFVRELPILRMPANVADGKYHVKLAVARGDQSLGSLFHPSVADLGLVEMKNRGRVMSAPVSIANPLEATFDKKIRLLGSDFKVDASRNARLILYWKSLALMDTPYSVFVHLLDSKDNVIASADATPGNGEFPTPGWVESEYITDVHSFAIPDGIAPATYRIEIGWYDPATRARLKTPDGQDRILLTDIQIPN